MKKSPSNVTSSGTRMRFQFAAFAALASTAFLLSSAQRAQATLPAVDFHVVAGGAALRNACFRLSGTAGQIAPGYSSSASDSVIAGFWSAAPTTGLDEIHFNGFENC
jgi:hypothetical protein